MLPYVTSKLQYIHQTRQAEMMLPNAPPPTLPQRAAPALLCSMHMCDFAFQAAYLLAGTRFFSWTHAASGVTICRALPAISPPHLPAKPSASQAPSSLARNFGALARTTSTFVRYGVVGSILALKALEWWYTVVEKRVEDRQRGVVPPPPPPPVATPLGAMLLAQPGKCLLCGKDYDMAA